MVTWSLLKLRNFDSYLMTLRDMGHVLELLLYPENIWAKNFGFVHLYIFNCHIINGWFQD